MTYNGKWEMQFVTFGEEKVIRPRAVKSFNEAWEDNDQTDGAMWRLIEPEFRVSIDGTGDRDRDLMIVSKTGLLNYFPELDRFLDHFKVDHLSLTVGDLHVTSIDKDAVFEERWMRQYQAGCNSHMDRDDEDVDKDLSNELIKEEPKSNWKTVPREYAVTDLEFSIMQSIAMSPYHSTIGVIDSPVPTNQLSIPMDMSGRQKSGVVSSLIKKGYVNVAHTMIALNAIGFEAFSDEAIKRNPPEPVKV